jgi:hypothetical protein
MTSPDGQREANGRQKAEADKKWWHDEWMMCWRKVGSGAMRVFVHRYFGQDLK